MRAERRRHAFTLLEVLAAVAVMGLVYSVLATAAIQGLRAEGDAGRRLRASLLADQRISEVEAQVAIGQTPAIGETESQEDEFVVRTEVKPLDLEVGETKASKRARDRLDRAVGARPKPKGDAPSLLSPTGASKQPLLRRIDLSVAWQDGASEESVRRTSYGLDAVAAAPLIEQLVAAAAAEKAKSREQAQQGQRPVEDAATGTPGRAPAKQLPASAPSGADKSGSAGGDR